jgi:hypothetical protein
MILRRIARIDSVNGGIRTTFDVVPDAPDQGHGGDAGRQEGPLVNSRDILVNSRDICKHANRRHREADRPQRQGPQLPPAPCAPAAARQEAPLGEANTPSPLAEQR